MRWLTRMEPMVRVTSTRLLTAKTARLAATAHASRPSPVSAAGSIVRPTRNGSGTATSPSTWSTMIFIGHGRSSETPVDTSITPAITVQPRQYGNAYRSSGPYRLTRLRHGRSSSRGPARLDRGEVDGGGRAQDGRRGRAAVHRRARG